MLSKFPWSAIVTLMLAAAAALYWGGGLEARVSNGERSLRDAVSEIRSTVIRIEDKLDRKADRPGR